MLADVEPSYAVLDALEPLHASHDLRLFSSGRWGASVTRRDGEDASLLGLSQWALGRCLGIFRLDGLLRNGLLNGARGLLDTSLDLRLLDKLLRLLWGNALCERATRTRRCCR